MFPMEYKREMDALAPSEAAMARLEALTKGESLEKPGRRLGRRCGAPWPSTWGPLGPI